MKLKSLAVVLALAAAGPAMAANCTDTFNLGVMGPPASAALVNAFVSTQHFSDCYNFTLASTANSGGFVGVFDWSWTRDIDLTSISLTGGSLANTLVDLTPSTFSFNNLVAGAYQLVIAGDVTGRNGGFLGGGVAGYAGTFSTSATVAAPVPEPETYAMLALGVAAVGWATRRRKQQQG